MTSSIDSPPINTLQGEPASLADFGGKAILAVNVASKCGLTPQYTGLEALHEQYADRGFTVVGFPCNQFGGQEPGSRRGDRDVLLDDLRRHLPDDGEDRRERRRRSHPIYAELTQVADAEGHGGDIRWNFEKFLIAPDGAVTRFSPMVTPDDPALVDAIEASLRPVEVEQRLGRPDVGFRTESDPELMRGRTWPTVRSGRAEGSASDEATLGRPRLSRGDSP